MDDSNELKPNPELEPKRLSRRTFIAGSAAVGALAAASPTALLDPASVLAAGKRGGTLRLGTADNFADFDPDHNPFGDFPFYNQLYGSLLRDVDQPVEGNALRWLATKIKYGPHNRYVDITLRKGVKFHGGQPFDAHAVVANLNKVNNPISGRDLYSVWNPILVGTQILNSHLVRVHFKNPIPAALLVALLTDLYFVSPKLIKKGEKAFLTHADGTGAFYLSSYRPGVSAILKRNKNFWKHPLPYFNQIDVNFFRDPTTLINSLQSGSLDMALDVPIQDVKSLKSAGIHVASGPYTQTYECILSTKPGRPFARQGARTALQYLIPRARYVKQVLFGLGQVAYVHVNKQSIGWEPAFDKKYHYNPALAKRKFAALGMLHEKPIEIVQLQGLLPTIGLLAEMLAGEMNAIGLNAKLVPVDISVWSSRFFGQDAGDFDILTSFMGRIDRYPTQPVSTNAGLFPVKNPCWPGGLTPKAYRNAYDNLLFALTPKEQRKWALALMKADLDYSWDIAVASFNIHYAMTKKVKGFLDSRDDFIMLDSAYFG